ncbi:MAG TPA: hypothetical protein VFK92_02950 [Burkholderiales bacterium]|nr:hypothetical protein [Burkholderiales bacterium]
MLRSVRPILALVALSLSFECAAGVGSGTFRVNISVNEPGKSALCVSQSLSQSTGALVQVLCSTGQFVSIGPRPGAPFAGVHGGAFTYYFSPTPDFQLEGSRSLMQGSGTVTEYRVYSRDRYDQFIDILVSF